MGQEQAIPVNEVMTRAACLNRELCPLPRVKRRVCGLQKKEQATHSDYEDVLRLYREKVRKSKA